MAMAVDGNLDKLTETCQEGSHTNPGNRLTKSPPRPYLPPTMAGKWAHTPKMKLPNEIVNDEKLKEHEFAKLKASPLLTPTNFERLTPKESNESQTWAGGKPPGAAETQHLLEQRPRKPRGTEAIVLMFPRPVAEAETFSKEFAAHIEKRARTRKLQTTGATST